MKALLKKPILILLVLGAVAQANPTTTTSPSEVKKATPDQSTDYQYEDYYYDDREGVLFSEDKPCPRDCICKASMNARIARCSRLEVGTQKFGDDVTGIVVENIDKNHPLVLTDMMFRKLGLHQITSVKIINSVIASISPTAFKGLHELYSVSLSGNSINKIHPDIFAYNEKLSLVELSDNPLTIDPESTAPFLNSSSIQELEVARCGLKVLPKNALTKLTNLMYINLSGNKLRELDSAVFSKLRILEEVDLRDNFLESIPNNLFLNNSEMATLRLRGNPLNTVIGVQMNELLTIDLSMAKINTVGPSMFDGMTLISNLNLSGNGIIKIHNQAFHQLGSLNYLDLSNNKLDSISGQLIKENVQLDIFKISKNPFLKNLPEEGFACSESQFNIYLFDASDCSIEKLPENFLKTMPALSQLLLSHNKIKSVGLALQKSTRLVEIDLSYNALTTLDKDSFKMNKDLGKLNLAGNPLTTLSAELFAGNPILTWLDVSSCHLNSIWDAKDLSAVSMSNLHFLNISNNAIKSVSSKELQTIHKLFTLDISENPLECNVKFQDLMKWLGDHNVFPAAVDLLSSKMVLEEKAVDVRQRWQFLAKKTCPPNIMTISNESDQEAEKAKVESILKKIEENPLIDINGEYIVDDDEEDDYDDDSGVSVYKEPKTLNNKSPEIKVPAYLPKIYESIDHNKIEIPFVNDMSKKTEITENFIEELEDSKRIEGEEMVATYLEHEYNYNQFLVPMLISLVTVMAMVLILVKFVMFCSDRNTTAYRIPPFHTPKATKVKKDCGLVYQTLSEDLTGPKTPIISRQILGGTNISYKSSPFHHSNITPEHV